MQRLLFRTRAYSAMALDAKLYHKLADNCLSSLQESFEAIGEKYEIPGYDVEYSV